MKADFINEDAPGYMMRCHLIATTKQVMGLPAPSFRDEPFIDTVAQRIVLGAVTPQWTAVRTALRSWRC